MTDRKEYYRQYYQEHKAERKARVREWKDKNKDKVSEYNHTSYIRRKAQNETDTPTQEGGGAGR